MEPAPVETEVHLRDYLRILIKRRWTVLAAFVIVVTTTAIVTFRQRPLFQAAAQLLIEKDNPNILSFKEVMELEGSAADYYQTQYQILQSRSLAKGVIERLRLAEHPEFGGPAPAARPAAADPSGAQAVVDAFIGRISVEAVRGTRLVNVQARAYDPKLAALMANTLAEIYIEENLQRKVDKTQEAGDWLAQQSGTARKRLEEAERALQRFNEVNNIVAVEERQSLVVQKLEELNSELTRARTARIELETRYNQLQALRRPNGTYEGVETMPVVMNNSVIQAMKTELARLEADLAEQSKVYTPKHPKIVGLVSQGQSLRQKVAEEISRAVQAFRNEYEVAIKREESLAAALEEQKKQVQFLNQRGIEYGALKREVENNRRIFEVLNTREKETGVVSGLRTNNIRMVDRAEVPRWPISPNKRRNLGLGLLLGLFAGLALAFFLEYLDDTIKDPDDLERYLKIPFLGVVPVLEPKTPGDGSRDLISLQEPKSIFAEAYRTVRTSLLFSAPDNPPRTFVITSTGPQEGKSLTAINLAVTMALTGNRVLLVDADMRRPRLHKAFGVDNLFGLSNLVGGDTDVGRALRKTPAPTLMLMTSGPIPPNPSELLGSARMGRLLGLLREKFDRVIIDCTPLISVTDATVLAARSDGVILVIKAGTTRRALLRRGKKMLEDVQARIIGAVLNQVDTKKSAYYSPYYHYHYHYYSDDKGGDKGGGKGGGKGGKAPASKA